MKISTRGRYGIRAMVEIAKATANNPIAIRAISATQKISERYLEQLLVPLKRDGYVLSVRGAAGGYHLGKPACNITVGDIIRTLEGPIAPVDCVIGDENQKCAFNCQCVTYNVWEKLKIAMEQILDGFSLQDLLDEEIAYSTNEYLTIHESQKPLCQN